MDDKIAAIAQVLLAFPEGVRVELAQQLLPTTYAVVPRQSNAAIEAAFRTAATRVHSGLAQEFRFNALAIPACWQAMVNEAAK
jgi:hypothetical protein